MTYQLRVEAPAKINLTLDVIRKREDGYHDLETVMQQISLCDILYFKPLAKGIKLRLNNDRLPNNEENLAYQAAELLLRNYNLHAGVEIYIEKNIPVGAGLAGGSTDAAAVLKGIAALFNLKIEASQMLKWGALLGADVPFCIKGGTALATGRGELLEPLAHEKRLNILIVKPPCELSTATIFKNYRRDKVKCFPNTPGFINAWEENSPNSLVKLASCMENVLESVSIPLITEIALIKEQLMQLGAVKALMSGSGPSVFAIFAHEDEVKRAHRLMSAKYESYKVTTYRGEM
jgi:4-diphosphocytidyl-2-C-methyl-D-erythritol kinase